MHCLRERRAFCLMNELPRVFARVSTVTLLWIMSAMDSRIYGV